MVQGMRADTPSPTLAEISAIYSGAYGLPALTGTGEQFRGRAMRRVKSGA
jgi:hypothetical protein